MEIALYFLTAVIVVVMSYAVGFLNGKTTANNEAAELLILVGDVMGHKQVMTREGLKALARKFEVMAGE